MWGSQSRAASPHGFIPRAYALLFMRNIPMTAMMIPTTTRSGMIEMIALRDAAFAMDPSPEVGMVLSAMMGTSTVTVMITTTTIETTAPVNF